MQISQIEATGALKITGVIEICEAEPLRAALAEYLGHAWAEIPAAVVDLSEVESCDTCGLQLLVSLRKSASKPLRFEIPEAVRGAMRQIGLSAGDLTPVEGGEDGL